MSSLLIPLNALKSCKKFYQFMSQHESFFNQIERHFVAIKSSTGYELFIQDQSKAELNKGGNSDRGGERVHNVHDSFRNAQAKSDTADFIEHVVALFQDSPVQHAVENVEDYACYRLHYLFWLSSKVASAPQLSIDSAASALPLSVGQRLLAVEHEPSAPSLLFASALAAGHKRTELPMQARLILETPSGSINPEQYNFILHQFSDSIMYHFQSLLPDFTSVDDIDSSDSSDSSDSESIGSEDSLFQLNTLRANEQNFIDLHYYDQLARLELIVRPVSKSAPYCIYLEDVFFDERLCRSDNINETMRLLEIQNPSFDYVQLSICRSGNINETMKLLEIQDASFPLRVYGNIISRSLVESMEACFLESQLFCSKQIDKLYMLQSDPTAFLKPANQWFVHRGQCEIMSCFRDKPTQLHVIPQKAMAHWFLEHSVKDVNRAMLSLLSRVQDEQPFTLPASAEIITVISHLMGYLLGHVDEGHITTYVSTDSLTLLRKAREEIKKPSQGSEEQIKTYKEKIANIYHACYHLMEAGDNNSDVVSQFFTKSFAVSFSQDFSNIAYPPYKTAFLITQGISLLTELYYYIDGKVLDEQKLFSKLPDVKNGSLTLISKGLFPLFFLQSEVDIPHLNRSTCLPVAVGGVSFDMHNFHDANDLTSLELLLHDVLFHTYPTNSIIDHHWKLFQVYERVMLMHNIDTVRAKLSRGTDRYIFMRESISGGDLLQVFDLLLFLLLHEADLLDRETDTIARMLPSAFSHTFLDKSRSYFEELDSDKPEELLLRDVYSDFTADMQKALPLKGNSTFPYYAAYIMVDTIVEQTRNAKPQGGEVSSDILFAAFEAKLAAQEKLIYLYEQNWERLVEENILYPECAKITSSAERHRALALPNFQERLRSAVIDWKLEKESLQAS